MREVRDLRGTVEERPFGQTRGNKHKHTAIVLVVSEAEQYRLIRTPNEQTVPESNPFRDPLLVTLVGQQISCTGKIDRRDVLYLDAFDLLQ